MDFLEAYSQAVKAFGRIDIVLNSAGIADESRWRKMVDINLTATIESTMIAAEHMRSNSLTPTLILTLSSSDGTEFVKGVIVNVASMAGLAPQPVSPVYAASKFGVIGFTRSLGMW